MSKAERDFFFKGPKIDEVLASNEEFLTSLPNDVQEAAKEAFNTWQNERAEKKLGELSIDNSDLVHVPLSPSLSAEMTAQDAQQKLQVA